MTLISQLVRESLTFTIKTLIVFIFGTILVVVAGAVVFGGINQSVDRVQKQMSVTGTAERKITPDSVSITLGKNMRGNNIADIQDKAAKSVNSLIEKLTALGIKGEEIKTSNYNLNPVYDSNNDIKSYAVNVGVTVTLERKTPEAVLVGNIIKAATESGIDEVRSLNFYLADSDKVARELEEAAINDARALAQKRAELAGARIGKVININFGGAYPYLPMYDALRAEAGAKAIENTTNVTINPGQFDLKTTVTIVYELY